MQSGLPAGRSELMRNPLLPYVLLTTTVVSALSACGYIAYDRLPAGATTADGGMIGDPDGSLAGALAASICQSASASTFLRCEDFERSDFGTRWNDVSQSSATSLTYSRDRAYRGTGAMKLSGQGGAETQAWVEHALSPPSRSGELFIRAYVFAESTLNFRDFGVLIQAFSPDAFPKAASLDVYGDRVTYYLNPEGGPAFAGPRPAAGQFTPQRWQCLTLALSMNATTGQVRVSGPGLNNGVGFTGQSSATYDTSYPSGVTYVSIGVASGPQTLPFVIYFDEVVISTTAVACDPG